MVSDKTEDGSKFGILELIRSTDADIDDKKPTEILAAQANVMDVLSNNPPQPIKEEAGSNAIEEIYTEDKTLKLSETQFHDIELCIYCKGQLAKGESLQMHLEKCKVYECPQCAQRFASVEQQCAHMIICQSRRKVASDKKIQCDACNKQLANSRSLRYHQEKFHAEIKAYVCNKCNKAFGSKKELQRHSVRCELRKDLDLKPKTTVDNKTFQCDSCDKVFSNRVRLRRHQEVVHLGIKPFSCSICDKAFGYKAHLDTHMMIHSGERPYTCQECGYGAITNANLKKHLTIHSDERPFQCQKCDSR